MGGLILAVNAVRRNRVATIIAELATDEDSRLSESALQRDYLELAGAPRIASDGGRGNADLLSGLGDYGRSGAKCDRREQPRSPGLWADCLPRTRAGSRRATYGRDA